MDLNEIFELMRLIRKSQKDPSTPVGACYSLQQYIGKDGVATLGECLPDGRYVIYAASKTKEIPTEHCGFPVIRTEYYSTINRKGEK